MDKRVVLGKIEYLLKWRGYGNEDNTWEPGENLGFGCDDLIEAFEKVRREKASKKNVAIVTLDVEDEPNLELNETSPNEVVEENLPSMGNNFDLDFGNDLEFADALENLDNNLPEGSGMVNTAGKFSTFLHYPINITRNITHA